MTPFIWLHWILSIMRIWSIKTINENHVVTLNDFFTLSSWLLPCSMWSRDCSQKLSYGLHFLEGHDVKKTKTKTKKKNSFHTQSVTIKLQQHKWTPRKQIPWQNKLGNQTHDLLHARQMPKPLGHQLPLNWPSSTTYLAKATENNRRNRKGNIVFEVHLFVLCVSVCVCV